MIGPEDRELVGKYLAGDLSREEERLLRDRIQREHGLSEELGSQAGIDALMRFVAGSIGLSEHFRLRLPDQAGRRRLAFLRHVLLPLSVAAGLLLIFYVSSEIAQRPPPELCAEIVEMRGNAELIVPGGHSSPRPGDIVGPGRRLKTGTACRLKLRYPDGTTIGMLAGSSLSLGKHRKAKRIALAGGEVHVNVAEQPPRHPMVISTPHAEVTVLGTRLALSVGPESTRLEVKEGRVKLTRLSDGRSVEVIAGQFAIAAVGVALAAQPVIRDWPQLGCNAQRWNYTPETIKPPFKLAWHRDVFLDFGAEHWIYGAVQVIVGDGRVYIGTKGGTMFAFDAKTGADCWQFKAGGPIIDTAGYANGRVFFTAMDGCVYALDAKTGNLAWKFESGRRFGFSTAVLLAEDKIFAVDRGGALFALSPRDGSQLWQRPYDAEAPVFQSPAHNNGRVFFGGQDMRIHAVDTKTGKRAWRSDQIDGQSLNIYWPVIFKGKVIVRPQNGYEATRGNSFTKRAQWSDISLADKSFVVLDEQTGKEVRDYEHVHAHGWCGPQAPPPVTGDGYLIMPWWPLKHKHKQHWSGPVLYDIEDGTGKVLDELRDGSGIGINSGDEPMIGSILGTTLVWVHAAGFDGNPSNGSGFYDRTQNKWFSRPATPPGTARGRYWENTQAGGCSAVTGAEGYAYHQAYNVVYGLKSE